jgi:hypothetical protein
MSDIRKISKSVFYKGLLDHKYASTIEKENLQKNVKSAEHQILINARAVLKVLLIEHKKDCLHCKRVASVLSGAIEHINDIDIVEDGENIDHSTKG